MLLVIDVGNTNIVFGVYRGDELLDTWRLSTALYKTADEIGHILNSTLKAFDMEVDSCIISSVDPDLTPFLVMGIEKHLNIKPLVANYKMKMNISLSGADKYVPAEVGSDRIADCAAAYDIYKSAVIVIDYGTATKYDVVSEDGVFLTGVTAPGIRICAEALFSRAALLGRVDVVLPKTIVAVDTITSVQAGIAFSAIGETEYIVNRLKQELNLRPDTVVVATGGLAHIVVNGSKIIDHHDPDLLLKGLKLLYEANAHV